MKSAGKAPDGQIKPQKIQEGPQKDSGSFQKPKIDPNKISHVGSPRGPQGSLGWKKCPPTRFEGPWTPQMAKNAPKWVDIFDIF